MPFGVMSYASMGVWHSIFPCEPAFRRRCAKSYLVRERQSHDDQAFTLLKTLFPSWVTLSEGVGPCPACDALAENSREDKRELRKKAEEEKVECFCFCYHHGQCLTPRQARLRHMQENALNGNTALLENVPCALVPANFVREWRLWILRPGHHPRPARLDNSPYLCDHDRLALDLNGGDLDRSVCLIRRPDWDALEEL
jgi:hypothetical protein